jgi:hypothetical protein
MTQNEINCTIWELTKAEHKKKMGKEDPPTPTRMMDVEMERETATEMEMESSEEDTEQ